MLYFLPGRFPEVSVRLGANPIPTTGGNIKRHSLIQYLVTLFSLMALLLPILYLAEAAPTPPVNVASDVPGKTYTISGRVTGDRGNLNSGVIVINEVMFFPETGEHDWVELKNIGSASIDINGYKLTDGNDHWYEIPGNLPPVPPGAFVVVVFDGLGSIHNDLDFADNLAVLHTWSDLIDILDASVGQVALYDDVVLNQLYLPLVLSNLDVNATYQSVGNNSPDTFVVVTIPSGRIIDYVAWGSARLQPHT